MLLLLFIIGSHGTVKTQVFQSSLCCRSTASHSPLVHDCAVPRRRPTTLAQGGVPTRGDGAAGGKGGGEGEAVGRRMGLTNTVLRLGCLGVDVPRRDTWSGGGAIPPRRHVPRSFSMCPAARGTRDAARRDGNCQGAFALMCLLSPQNQPSQRAALGRRADGIVHGRRGANWPGRRSQPPTSSRSVVCGRGRGVLL